MFQENKFIVNFNQKTYDIKYFISKHPGGVQTLQNLGNSAIDDKLKKYHHSEAAMNLFEQYRMEKTTMNDDLEVKKTFKMIINFIIYLIIFSIFLHHRILLTGIQAC